MKMSEFLFVDNEYDVNQYYIIKGNLPLPELRYHFRRAYTELMEEYRDGNTDERGANCFYDELEERLEKYNIILSEPKIYYHHDMLLAQKK